MEKELRKQLARQGSHIFFLNWLNFSWNTMQEECQSSGSLQRFGKDKGVHMCGVIGEAHWKINKDVFIIRRINYFPSQLSETNTYRERATCGHCSQPSKTFHARKQLKLFIYQVGCNS